jgi:hypothetical protein
LETFSLANGGNSAGRRLRDYGRLQLLRWVKIALQNLEHMPQKGCTVADHGQTEKILTSKQAVDPRDKASGDDLNALERHPHGEKRLARAAFQLKRTW